MAASALAFTLMAACAKILGPRIPTEEKVFCRSLFSVLVTLWAIRRWKVSLRPRSPFLLLARALVGFFALTFYFEAIARIPLGNAVVLLYINPVVAGILAALFLGEVFRRGQIVASLVCLAGVALVARPSPGAPLAGSLFGLSCGLLSGTAYTMVRALNRRGEDPLRIVLSFPLVSLPLSLMVGAGAFVMPHGSEWLWILALGVTTQAGQVCLTLGLRHEEAARAAQVGFLAPVFAMLLGIPLGDGLPSAWSLAGSALIVLAVLGYRPRRVPPPRPIG